MTRAAPLFLIVGCLVGFVGAGQIPLGQSEPASVVPAVASPAIPRELTSYREIVKRVLPAVVSIQANSRINGRAAGSGVIIDPKGIVVTNHHVVAGAREVEVTLQSGRKYRSRAIFSDPKTDLAIVKLAGLTPLPYLELGDSDAMEIGDRVLAVGAPFGLSGTVTHGIISGKGRVLNMNVFEDFLQTDAPINPGNSGGPLINLEGKVIGINSAIKTSTGGSQGIGLAIPSNMVKDVVTQLERDGVVRRGYLGVAMEELTPDLAERLQLGRQRGVLITEVYPDTPAARGGLTEGDVIIAFNGQPVTDGLSLQRAVGLAPLGQAAEVTIIRDGNRQKLSITIEQQPDDFGLRRPEPARKPERPEELEPITLDRIGLTVTDLTAERAEELGYRGPGGVLVVDVAQDSLAYTAGLRAGMVILEVEKRPVRSAAALKEAVSAAAMDEGILFLVRGPRGSTRYIVLQAGK
jgi:serine protease Do